MIGFIMSIIAGAAMSIQGVMNTRLSEGIGLYESNAFVQGTAFVLSLIAMFLLGHGNFKALGQVNKLYWLGGALGLVITLTVMVGIQNLSPTIAISVILISQLLSLIHILTAPAALAPRIPCKMSSNTAHCAGGTSSFCAANR